MSNIKIGSVVVYTNEYSRNTPGHIWECYEELIGKRAEVTSIGTETVQVKWLEPVPTNTSRGLYKGNVTLLPSKEEIDSMLVLLQAAGDVQFTPRKPAYVSPNITIAGYICTINASGEMFNVGCKNIPFSKVEEVYLAVVAAREYNKA